MRTVPAEEGAGGGVDERRRDQLNRALRLLRKLQEGARAGDPLPSLAELCRLTGLPQPAGSDTASALPTLITLAEAERKAVNRRLGVARALADLGAAEVRPAAPPPPPPAADPFGAERERLLAIKASDLDGLPYGAILLDRDGRVMRYNDAESRLARLPVDAVVGRNFFTEVAPCTRVKEFEGRFRSFAAADQPGLVEFEFTFPFPFGAQRVSVLLTPGPERGTVLMALLRR